MDQDEPQLAQAAYARTWGIDDEAEPTRPRLALGTRELAPLSHADFRRDLAYEEVARIVHDLKGPLGTISLEVELLAEDGVATATGDTSMIVDRIIRNVAFLDRLVMDLLDRCTLEAGQLELRCVPTELRALLEHVVARAVPTRERHRVIIEAHQLMIVMIDDLRIERVVANLLHNALRYSPQDSIVTVRLERGAGVARVSVIDRGDGIAESALAGIFDEYRRGAPASPRQGTGIGLFLSKQIVEAHGATMTVESTPRAGTQFSFELPTTF